MFKNIGTRERITVEICGGLSHDWQIENELIVCSVL